MVSIYTTKWYQRHKKTCYLCLWWYHWYSLQILYDYFITVRKVRELTFTCVCPSVTVVLCRFRNRKTSKWFSGEKQMPIAWSPSSSFPPRLRKCTLSDKLVFVKKFMPINRHILWTTESRKRTTCQKKVKKKIKTKPRCWIAPMKNQEDLR